MQTLEEIHVLLTQWAYLLMGSLLVFGLICYFTFHRQLDHGKNELPDSLPVPDWISECEDRVQVHEQSNTTNTRRTNYTPENCFKYTSCVLSTINCFICAPAGLIAFFYHEYWKDPIYGTPGIAFHVLAIFTAYLLVDLIAMFVVYCRYHLSSLLWDVILHHLTFIACVMAMMYIMNGWIIISGLLTMEFSTIFLNAQFMAKWYKCSESFIFKLKLGFLATWFSVRVPVALVGIPIYFYLYAERLWKEWPPSKAIAYWTGMIAILIMQLMWTILIVQKTYRTLFDKDTVTAVDNFDLVPERDSIDEEKSKEE